jgi:integrase
MAGLSSLIHEAMYLLANSPLPHTPVPTAEVDPSCDHYYQHKDGRTATVRLELRANGVWAIDLRKFGGGRPTLKEPGQKFGVKKLALAKVCANRVLSDLLDAMPGPRPNAAPSGWKHDVEQHLAEKQAGGAYGPDTAEQADYAIRRCLTIAYGMGVRRLQDLSREHVGKMVVALRALPNKRNGQPLSTRYIRQHLMYLSGLFSWALDLDKVQSNPLAKHKTVPASPVEGRRVWLEPSHAQGLLGAVTEKPHHKSPHLFWLLAMMLYTGMGPAECFGLMVSDLNFDLHQIQVVYHPHRRLKNRKRVRTVPMWPRLEQYLRQYLELFNPPADGLLFPKPGVRQESGAARRKAMWKSIRGSVHSAAKRAEIVLEITPYVLRHTYCSIRSQMVEQGPDGRMLPVDQLTITREMGHGSDAMVKDVYTHVLREKYRFVDVDYERFR